MKFKVVKKWMSYIFALSVILGIVFVCLSDANKAKTTLFLLGVHEKNVNKFSAISNLIKTNNFDKYLEFKDLPPKYIQLIEGYLNEGSKLNQYLKITDVYTSHAENWHTGCNPSREEGMVLNKVEYILYSNDAIIICSRVGGFGVSSIVEFFKIDTGKLELVGAINQGAVSLFQTALFMKFEEGLLEMEWEEAHRRNDLLAQ